jgi:hypothetical protein
VPIRWDVDPGGEWLIPFAKKKLAQLKAQFADLDIDNLQRWYQVDESTRVGVASMAGFDRITVRGAGGRYSWVESTEVGGHRFFVSRLLGSPMNVGPNEEVVYLTAEGTSALAGAIVSRRDRNSRDEVLLAVTEDGVGGTTLWFGWLTKHRNGGRFTSTSTRSFTAFTKLLLSSSGTRLLIKGSAGDVNVIQKVDVVFTEDDEGAITTAAVFADLLDGALPGGFTYQNEMYFNSAQTIGYVWGHDSSELQVERLFALDVETGVWSTAFDFAETGVDNITVRPDEQGTVWSVVTQGDQDVYVYRGATLVCTVVNPAGLPVVLADPQHAVSSSGDTFAFALRVTDESAPSGFAVKFVAIHNTEAVVTDLGYSASRWVNRAPIVPPGGLLAFYEPADPSVATVDALRPRVVVFTEAEGTVTSETQIVRSEVAGVAYVEDNYRISGAGIQWYSVGAAIGFVGDVRMHSVTRVTPEGGTPYWERTIELEKTAAQLGGRFLEPVASTRHWVL